MHLHAPQLSPEKSHAPPQIPWLPDRVRAHAPPWRPRRPPICLLKKYGFQPMSHAPPRATWISGYSSTHPWTCMLLPRAEISCWCHLTSPDDVISPCQHHASTSTSARATSTLDMSLDTSASHVSSVASSAPRHLAYRWPGPTRPGLHGSDPLALTVDFDFLRWLLTKSQNFRHGLSCSVFRINFNFGLRFFIWNSKLGQLAHSSLWFLQRHFSRHLQMIFSCLSNLKPSSSFRLEFEGGC